MPKPSQRGAANALRILQIVLMVLLQLALPLQSVTSATAADQAAPAAVVASAPEAAPLDAVTADPGICSNDKTKACSVNADCGAGTCYLPTAGGQTLDNQVCMQQAAGFGIQCTANDVNIADTHNLKIVKACGFPGDTAVISFVAEYNLTAQDRYDVGVWIAQDGGNALTGKCSVSDFPTAPTPPWTNLDAAQPGDTCGDITATNNPLYSSIENITVECNDTNGDGKLDINTCLSWRQSGANDLCNSPLDAFPGSPSKCKCQTLPGIDIPVPGVIKVDKITYDANGNAKPGDPTSFPFTLTGGPDSVSKSFSLTDAAAPYNSGGLKVGTYAVAENVPSGWQLMGSSCVSDQAGRSPTPTSIALHNGETVTCTFKDKVAPAPHLKITKAASESTYSAVGDVIHYTIVATNDGNVTLGAVTVTDPAVSGLTCTPANGSSLAPGASMTCTATHTVTQADLDAGHFANTACVDDGANGAAQACASKDVPGTKTPKLSLTKSASPTTYDHVGQVITYTYVVKNSGNVTLPGPFSISDDKLGAISCPTGSLAPNATVTCTATYTIKQSDLDAGKVTNVATASTSFEGKTVTSNEATATITATQNPHLQLTKSVAEASFNAVGQTLHYTLVAKNNGGSNVTLSNVTISDPKLGATLQLQGGGACAAATLAPEATITCVGSYTVTQADLDAGFVHNTATAVGWFAGAEYTATAEAEVPGIQAVTLGLTKSASPATYDHVGQVIAYSYVVTNTGNVDLSGPITVADNKATVTCPAVTTFAPGASVTCSATYTITQADLDAGFVTNVATASAMHNTQQVLSNEATATVNAVQNPHIDIVKSVAEASFTKAGDVLHYTMVATNDGNVTLHNVTISDPLLGTLVCTPAQPATLAPTAKLTCTGSYTVQQSDVDAGKVTNVATASGLGPKNQPVSDTDTKTVPSASAPHITLVKTATPHFSDPPKPGDTISYTLVATNDDDVTLNNVTITDAKLGTLTCTPAQPAVLAPKASLTCTGSYTLTQADIDAGHVANTAFVTSKLPGGGEGPSDDDSKDVPVPQSPKLAIVKTAEPTTYDEVGDVISYTIVATNTGNVTLHDVMIADPMFASLTCTPTQPATLAPAATLTCTGSHTITQADLDAGHVANTACVDDGQGGAAQVCASKDVPGEKHPALSITKAATEGDFDEVGDVIHYTIVAKNVGNVTLSNVRVTDPAVSSLNCDPPNGSSLAPGASMTCTATHTVTQADLDAGHYYNQACVDDGQGNAEQVCAEKDVPGEQTPAISLTKTPDLESYDHVGQVITYTLVARNTGNVTLHDVMITDPKLGALTCTPAQPATLAPNATLSCQGAHTVVQADLDAGKYDNTATVNGKGPKEQPVSAEASASVPAIQVLALEIEKQATETSYSKVGDVIHFTIVATNTGNVTLPTVTVTDPRLGDEVTCSPANGSALAPGEKMTCTTSYVIDQGDIDEGHFLNTACVDDGAGNVEQKCANKDVPGEQTPHISLTKTTTTTAYDHVGQVIPYTLVATNDGNTTLHDVMITDPKLGTLTCSPAQPAVLGPTYKLTCTGSHTVTQADLDAGKYDNTATVNGKGPKEQPVSATASASVPATQSPALLLTKKALPTTYQSVGNKITYTYVLKNSGNVTLSGQFWVTDDKVTVTCPDTASLAPGASITCTATYTITQADLNADSVTNHAVGHGFWGQTQVDSNEATATVYKIVVLPETGDPSSMAGGIALIALALLLVGLRFRLQTAARLVRPDGAPRG